MLNAIEDIYSNNRTKYFFRIEDNYVFRISTGCIKDNLGSKKVMQKCGMIKEAELKMNEWHDGRMKDRVLYRLLKNEWVINGAKKSIQIAL